MVLDINLIGSKFIKTTEVLIAIRYDITGGHPCHHSASSSTHSSSQPGESHQAKQLHLKATIIARLSILILSKTYPTKVTSRHVGLLAGGFVLPKSN
jgi:hypothetical protein